jgi:acetylornithine deacetylase/succinyl-diaminopimelate desuccinylase-like protein
MNPVVQYAETHFEEFVDKLAKLVRIPSISFDGFPPANVRESADAVAALLREEGLENVQILEVEGAHPYVYGDWLHASGKPTLLLYAHHDVQPPGREQKWKSPPFEPVVRDGRLFGRGSADDKAGVIVHTSAIASYLKMQGKLPVNVKVIVEGEEEIGSEHLEAFLKKYSRQLQGDIIILTDSANFDTGIPTITTSLRGIVATEVEVRVMDHPLHSGTWGGPGPDPVLALAKMLAALVDENGRIAIPGIYEDVLPLSEDEEESLRLLNYTDADFRRQAQILPSVQILGGQDNALKKMTRLPSLAINAIQASSRRSVANIINEAAWCKVGIRTVPNMDPQRTERQLRDFLNSHAPWGVEVQFHAEQSAPWWTTRTDGPAFEKARAALSQAFGRECVYVGQGGSIPFVGPFAAVLGGAPALLVGVEDPDTNAHSENESVHLGDLKKSIIGAIYFYEMAADIPTASLRSK